MHSHSLLIIDDHPVYRDALGERLARDLQPSGVTVSVVGTAHEGLEHVEANNSRWIVLLDILMPGLSGLAGIKAFKHHPSVAHVVAISGLDEHLWEPRTVAAGATMFLSKNSTSDHICKKLVSIMSSDIELRPTTPQNASQEATAQGLNDFRLTARQREVLTLIAQGHPNKIIADYLEISEQTVKIHINQIFKELRVFNRTQAVLKAQKHQLL
jgi:DNA-binding NarL/FixJ family response regulator